MGSVIIDAITRNLEETVRNLDYLEKDGLIDFLTEVMIDTFDTTKNRALKIIETGEGMTQNIGKYALHKQAGWIFTESEGGLVEVPPQYRSQPLGRITDKLYQGVKNTPVGPVKKTRGKEVRIDTRFTTPSYIGDVHDGRPGTAGARPFMDAAAKKVEDILTQRVDKFLSELDVTSPPPQFISTLISRSPMRGIVVY